MFYLQLNLNKRKLQIIFLKIFFKMQNSPLILKFCMLGFSKPNFLYQTLLIIQLLD